jgi:hypothetical protein
MNWTALGHLVLALSVLAAVCVLAGLKIIPGNDAFTVIVGVAIGGGVLAGVNVTQPNVPPSKNPPAPPPAG